MKYIISILLLMQLLAACSSNPQVELNKPKAYSHDSMNSTLQQQLTVDSMFIQKIELDFIQYRHLLTNSIAGNDVLERQLENLLKNPRTSIKADDLDSLKLSIRSLRENLIEQTDVLKVASEHLNATLAEIRMHSGQFSNLKDEVAALKHVPASIDSAITGAKTISTYETITSLEKALVSTQKTTEDLQSHLSETSRQLKTLISDPNVKLNQFEKAESYQKELNDYNLQLSDLKDYVGILENQVSSSLFQRDRATAEQPLVKFVKSKPEVPVKPQPNPRLQPESAKLIPVSLDVDSEAKAVYEQARNSYESRVYDKAINQFTDFLVRYPGHELASNAHYWMGETYYATEDYQQALVELQKVLSDYPQAPKAPDAKYKIGMTYLRMGDPQRAKQEFSSIHTLYPNYENMDRVNKQLRKLK